MTTVKAKSLFDSCFAQLEKAGIDEAKPISFLLLEDAFQINKTDIFLNSEIEIDRNKFESLVERLKKNEPIQHVLGFTYFRTHKFFVNENALIPRPETEEIIGHIQKLNLENPNIIDIGTGSGCIAVSLALELRPSNITALDISAEALDLAKKNALVHEAELNFIHSDFLNQAETLPGNFDIIVSNPPYIRELEKANMAENVLDYEPHLALFVPDEDPLIFYRALAEFGLKQKRELVYIFAEINSYLGEETKALFEEKGYEEVSILKDFYEKDRFVRAKKTSA